MAVVANLILRAIGVTVVDIPLTASGRPGRPVVRSTLGGVIAAGLAFAAASRGSPGTVGT